MADFSTVATSVIVTLGIQTLYYLVMSFPDQLHRTDPKRKNYAALKLRNLVCGGSLEGREEPLIWASVDTAKRRFCGYCGRRSPETRWGNSAASMGSVSRRFTYGRRSMRAWVERVARVAAVARGEREVEAAGG